jgi:peptidoglycan hydrolase-like protein with peptidoglycan-binding domain
VRKRLLAALAVTGVAASAVAFAVLRDTEPEVRTGATTPTTTTAPTTSSCTTTSTTTSATTTTTTTTTTSTSTTTTTAPPTTAPTTPPPTAPPPTDLAAGASGPAVVALQQRLLELGYWLRGATGSFEYTTTHAVIALQKTAGLGRTGVVDAATKQALAAGVRPTARSTAGRVIEIDLARQILSIVDDGRVTGTLDTSTGRPGLETPVGRFSIYTQVNSASYDGMYRPKYFYAPRGLAIHGYSSVPTYPYSHGCARVINPAMDLLWVMGISIGTPVWVY